MINVLSGGDAVLLMLTIVGTISEEKRVFSTAGALCCKKSITGKIVYDDVGRWLYCW